MLEGLEPVTQGDVGVRERDGVKFLEASRPKISGDRFLSGIWSEAFFLAVEALK